MSFTGYNAWSLKTGVLGLGRHQWDTTALRMKDIAYVSESGIFAKVPEAYKQFFPLECQWTRGILLRGRYSRESGYRFAVQEDFCTITAWCRVLGHPIPHLEYRDSLLRDHGLDLQLLLAPGKDLEPNYTREMLWC